MHAIVQSVLPGELIFDIGANAGDKSAWFAERDVRVVAVEPQPKLAEQLRIRFADNPLVTIVDKGIGAETGTLNMSIAPTSDTLSTFSPEWRTKGRFKGVAWSDTVPVSIITLDRLIEDFGLPRYAKMMLRVLRRRLYLD